MTSTSARSSGSPGTHIVHRGEAGAGPFMLTLCQLIEPVSIRPPQSPRLRPFTFFTSRAPQQDGSEPLYLHMGFFETLGYAEKWARAVRGRHPDAIATIAPSAFWQGPDSNQSLTDTQVFAILDKRGPATAQNGGDDPEGGQIELLRPDDTGTRLALKEAVARGAPVSFAVQLQWSGRPIDPGSVPELAIFKAHTLYAVESRRPSRSCFFLRLGFFADPVSARQAASHVRSSFACAAVVPVLEEEVVRARGARTEMSAIPCLLQQHPDQVLESGGMYGQPIVSKPESGRRRSVTKGAETLEQTLAQLAERERWNDSDFLSETGVRHLKVEVEKLTSGGRH